VAASIKNGFVPREVLATVRFSSITVGILLFAYPVKVRPWLAGSILQLIGRARLCDLFSGLGSRLVMAASMAAEFVLLVPTSSASKARVHLPRRLTHICRYDAELNDVGGGIL
jgi:hypothetical protein